MYIHYLFVLKAAHACNANRRKHTPVRLQTRTQHVCKVAYKHTHEKNMSKENKLNTHYISSKVWLEAQQRLFRRHTLVP